MKKTNVFVLMGSDGRPLPPAQQASVLAKYSRSPLSAREILAAMTVEDAEAFQEKWGVSYGHASVAELVTLPYCFENVSIIASKFLEKYQRGAYSEKSTRYQVFTADSFVEPEGAHPALRQAAEVLYHAYTEMEKPVLEYVRGLVRTAAEVSGQEMPTESVIKARAFDNLRYLLPAGTGTNLAAVVNARDARYMMSDLLGSDLPELRVIGEAMTAAAGEVAPVFALGAKPNAFEPRIKSLGYLPSDAPEGSWWVRIKDPRYMGSKIDRYGCDAEAVEGFWRRACGWYDMTPLEFANHMEDRGKNQVPDVFKTLHITYDVMMDYGAFRDLQRQRRCEQYVEPLSPNYGYLVPDDLIRSPFEAQYRSAMDRAFAICRALLASGGSLDEVQYALPLGTLHRSQFQMDLRQVYYVGELRTQPQGHISYRRIAWEMVRLAKERYPEPMRWCRAINPVSIGQHT